MNHLCYATSAKQTGWERRRHIVGVAEIHMTIYLAPLSRGGRSAAGLAHSHQSVCSGAVGEFLERPTRCRHCSVRGVGDQRIGLMTRLLQRLAGDAMAIRRGEATGQLSGGRSAPGRDVEWANRAAGERHLVLLGGRQLVWGGFFGAPQGLREGVHADQDKPPDVSAHKYIPLRRLLRS